MGQSGFGQLRQRPFDFILLQRHVDFDGGMALKNPLRGIAAVTEVCARISDEKRALIRTPA